jgi:hypothetical protein
MLLPWLAGFRPSLRSPLNVDGHNSDFPFQGGRSQYLTGRERGGAVIHFSISSLWVPESKRTRKIPPSENSSDFGISAAGVDVADVNAAIVRRDVSRNTRNSHTQRRLADE